MRIDDLKVGMSAETTTPITDADVVAFAGIVGDFNPVHLDAEFAAKSRFGGRIAHGMLIAGLLSGVLAMKLPGPGVIYLGQTLKFTKPVMIGDTITARVEVTEIIVEKKRARLATTCRNQRGDTVIEGDAIVLVPDG